MSGGTAFLSASVVMAIFVVTYDALIKPALTRMYYDDSPPINFLSARLEKTVLRAGEPIKMSFVYTKRRNCHPPLAPPALVRFRVWLKEKDYVWLRYENRSYAPDSRLPRETPFREIPMPHLEPGNYQFQWTAMYECSGASHPITVESPKLPFSITEK